MKKILIILLMAVSLSAFSQGHEYGEMKITKKPKGVITFHQNGEGKPLPYKTFSEAMTYLSEQGWELVEVYTASWAGGTIYYYILRKES